MQQLLGGFLKVTESAALSALPFIGSGDEMVADKSATTTMRRTLNEMKMNGTIVIGEGEIDEAPMLYIGEKVGTKQGVSVDIAVDPIEGTTVAVNGQFNSLAVIAAGPKGHLLHAPDMYMEKIAVGPKAKGKINLNAPLYENLKIVAEANRKQIHELNICVQDRPRHHELIQSIRETGAKVHLFKDGDVIYTIATCLSKLDFDMFIGVGGAPEGVLGAVALKALGGDMHARLLPENEEEELRCKKMGIEDPNRLLTHDDLVVGDDCMLVATGITDSILVDGIQVTSENYVSHSIILNGLDKKVRYVTSEHKKEK